MVRKATEDDLENLISFRCATFGGTRAAAEGWLCRVAGLENILLVDAPATAPPPAGEPADTEPAGADDGQNAESTPAPPAPTPPPMPAAMLCAVPVSCDGRRGILFCGMSTQPAWKGLGLMTKLISGCLRAYAASGCEFALTAQVSRYNAGQLAQLGFQPAFPQRLVEKNITRNLWAQADFDTMTVKRLQQARLHYQPACICLPEPALTESLSQMYTQGATVVSSPRGYGIYYQKGSCLQFLELQADNDHSADLLLQAARETTGAETAKVLLSENQALYLGEGRRCGCAMLRFLKEPFPIRNVYFRLLLGE